LKQGLGGKIIFLFLDYDGTLAPIADRPNKALIPGEVKKLLKSLTKIPNCNVSIISGRAVNDVKKRVGIKNIIYAGNHGLEIEGPKIKFKVNLTMKFRITLAAIKKELIRKLLKIKGVFMEDKGLTLSLHYRLVDKRYIPRVKTIFYETIATHLAKDKIQVKSGKMVLELRPPVEWDKGKIVLWLLARRQFTNGKKKVLPIYVGDDVSDEDAFRILKNKAITVVVGQPKQSYAKYYLKSTREVTELLKQILDYCNTKEQ